MNRLNDDALSESRPVTVITVLAGVDAARLQRILPDIDIVNAPAAYIDTLVARIPALIIVDETVPDWQRWVTTPKVSPATRRVPLVVLTEFDTGIPPEDRVTRDLSDKEPMLAGADGVVSAATFWQAPAAVIVQWSRSVTVARQEQLDIDCAQPLPDLATEGVRAFNDGRYYQQHDLFEALWVETPTPVRELYRAILQVGVAYYQIERGNYRGAVKMLQRSRQWFDGMPETCQGIEVALLYRRSQRVLDALQALPDEDLSRFDSTLLHGVGYVSDDGGDAARG